MQASYSLIYRNTHLRDADAAAKVAGVSVATVLQERVDDFTLNADNTVIVSSGQIERTILVDLTPGFLTRFPDETTRRNALGYAFKGVVSMGIPGSVEDNLTLIP